MVCLSAWIDARSRCLLTDGQKGIAKRTLESLFLRWNATTLTTEEITVREEMPNLEAATDFQAYLDVLASSQEAEPQSSSPINDFQSCLADIERLGRVKGKNIWEIIDLYPEPIRPLARTVSSLPSTQVSVERIFSHLKLILRENRASMASDLAEAVLFLRTNKCA